LNHTALEHVQAQEGNPSNKQINQLAEQSELFGRGIFNDPLSGSYNTGVVQRFSNNFASLHNHGTRHDFEKHWMVVYFFDELEKLYDASCHGSNSAMVDTWSSNGDALAVTPMRDLMGLGENAITPLFQSSVTSVGMDLEFAFISVQSMTKDVPGGPQLFINNQANQADAFTNPIVFASLTPSNSEWKNVLLSADGNMKDIEFTGLNSTIFLIDVVTKTFNL